MELYGATGYAITVGPDALRLRYAGESQESRAQAPPLTPPEDNSLDYLVGVLRGQINPDGSLTGLDTNVVVVQILDAARESVKTGKTVVLSAIP
jgi:lipopolysaccharide export system protein LptC